jgi:addiction module HigA family antidote
MEAIMNSNQLEPIHPGEILLEEFMVPYGITMNALAIALRVPASRIGKIVHGQRSITPDTALRLSRFFGTSPELWLGLQTEYDLRTAERTIGEKIAVEVKPHAA